MLKELRAKATAYQSMCDRKWRELEKDIDILERCVDEDSALTDKDCEILNAALNLVYLQLRLNITSRAIAELESEMA
jgi:hypothetical protein